MTAPARCPLLSGAFSAAFAACSERCLGLIGVALHCMLAGLAHLLLCGGPLALCLNLQQRVACLRSLRLC